MSEYDQYLDAVRGVSIVRVVGQSVELKKKGNRHVACCPFHAEKTPSFQVTEKPPLWYCHGCGVGGDSIKFVMMREECDFPQAVERIGGIAGLVPPERKSQRQSLVIVDADEVAARSLLEDLSRAHAEILPGTETQEYLLGRGLKQSTLDYWQVGHGPADRKWLDDVVSGRWTALQDCGLTKQGEDGTQTKRYWMSGRVVFPVKDAMGRHVTLAGRVLPSNPSKAKYVNGRNSLLFSKGEHLYGAQVAKQECRQAREIWVVEGYLDVIGLWQAGVKWSCAPMGTALTGMQAKLLSRWTNRVVLCLDADPAGLRAARRALPELFSAGLEVVVMLLPKGEDPFDVAMRGGEKELKACRAQAKDGVDFLLWSLSREFDPKTATGRAKVAQAAADVIAYLPDPLVRSAAYSTVAERLKMQPDALEQKGEAAQPVEVDPRVARPHGVSSAEMLLVAHLVLDESAREWWFSRPSVVGLERELEVREICSQIRSAWPKVLDIGELFTKLGDSKDKAVLHDSLLFHEELQGEEGWVPSIGDCSMELARERRSRRAQEIQDAIAVAERKGQLKEVEELVRAKARLFGGG